MGIVVALILLALALFVAYKLSHGKSEKKKYMIWGITTMVAIAPLVSSVISILYRLYAGDEIAAYGLLMLLLPILFFMGSVIFFMGIFIKGRIESH